MGVEHFYKSISFITYPFAKKRFEEFKLNGRDYLWFHAASMGEVTSIIPVIKEINKRNLPFFITTMTESGKKKARELTNRVFLFPYDNPLFIKKLIQSSKLCIFCESELWPNTLLEIKRQNKKAMLINGRMSEKSFKRWKAFKNFGRKILNVFEIFYVISKKEKFFLKSLGVDEKKIKITGNLKFLNLLNKTTPLFQKPFKKTLTLASLRSKEFREAVNFMERILKNHNEVGFIIAVRHLNTLILFENLLRAKKIEYIKFSEKKDNIKKGERVIILDTLGDLIKVFPESDIVIVGGTFKNYGGHNLMEPAQFSVPVFFGPYTSNVKSMEEELIKEEGGKKVKSFEELYPEIEILLSDEKKLKEMGEKAKKACVKAKEKALKGFNEIINCIEKYYNE